MANNNKAISILSKSFKNIQDRQGQFTKAEVEAEVINQACKFIIENYKNEIKALDDISQLGVVRSDNLKFQSIAIEFTNAAAALFPDQYGKAEQSAAVLGIIGNISWAGMWDFLIGYFQKKHGMSIDERATAPSIFYSTSHKRYQSGELVSESEVERNISCNFFNDMHEIVVSIEPTLSAKKANLINSYDNKLIYLGEDPDYKFELYLDQYEEIEKFVLELPNRSLKIIYY